MAYFLRCKIPTLLQTTLAAALTAMLVVSLAALIHHVGRTGKAYYETNPEYFESMVWTSTELVDRTQANEDGSLAKYRDNWYIAHRWSGYGKIMADMRPGDTVTVDGVAVTIRGRFTIPIPFTVKETLAFIPNDYDMILMTCTKDNKHEIVLYG